MDIKKLKSSEINERKLRIMKITKEGTVHSVKTKRIHYLEYTGTYLLPMSIQFTIEYESTSTIPETIQSIPIPVWFEKMLENKIIKRSDTSFSSLYEKFLIEQSIHGENVFLNVESTTPHYLSRTLFQILQKLLPENKINYLEYELE